MNSKKIAYYTVVDPLDKRSWSGTAYYIGKALEDKGYAVDFLGPVEMPGFLNLFFRAVAKANRIVFKSEYFVKHSLLWGRYAAHMLRKKMKGNVYDFICAPGATAELAFLKSNVPVIYIADTTFKLISNYYSTEYKNVCLLSKWEGNYLEKKALKKTTFAIYSSHWAAASAVDDYGFNKNKIEILPLGANMDLTPSKDLIFQKLKNETLTLLYLAVDWERKGGYIAYETCLYLNNIYGIKTRLIVCGCEPPEEFSYTNVEVISFLDKNITAQYEEFVHLLSSVHFLIIPTRADCSLVSACEGSAFGVPVITTYTGGVPDIVENNVNGYCLPYTAESNEYAKLIAEIYKDKPRYKKLIEQCRQRFEERLNWDKWSENFVKLYNRHILKQSKFYAGTLQKAKA